MSSNVIPPITYQYNRPIAFYTLVTVIPWGFWFCAAYLSRLENQSPAVLTWTALLGVCGLVAPVLVVVYLVRKKPDLQADILNRLVPKKINWFYAATTLLLLPSSILAAQTVSITFGYSPDQFQLRGGFTFTAGLLPVWFTLIGAAIFEELAWHSYGTDTLLRKMSVFKASMVFTGFWALWHLPLGFIEGYYHNEVVEMGWLHTLNFPLSMVAFVILMNWLYFRTGRVILVAVVFHITANLANEVFMTHPDTKIIQTVLLLLLSAVILATNRDLFFDTSPKKRKAIQCSEQKLDGAATETGSKASDCNPSGSNGLSTLP